MATLFVIAGKELRDGLRNRWVLAATLLLAGLALGLSFLGGAPTGSGIGASRLAVVVVSLASLTIFLVPLIALLLSHDALIGEIERGTMLLLLTYPVARWQVVWGKLLGHTALVAIATLLGYGAAAAVLSALGEGDAAGWRAFALLMGSSVLLGAVFLGIGYLASGIVRERGTAAGLAVGVWLVFVLLFDLALLGTLAGTEGRGISATAFSWVLMLNPADVFRLLNLTTVEEVKTFAGMTGVASGTLATPVLVAVLLAWVVVPVGLASLVFHRRQL